MAQAAARSLDAPGHIQRLRDALRDPDPAVRESAARALERMRRRENLPELLEHLRSGDMLARLNAIYALGSGRDPSCVAAPVQVLDDPSEDVRAAAVRTLGDLD